MKRSFYNFGFTPRDLRGVIVLLVVSVVLVSIVFYLRNRTDKPEDVAHISTLVDTLKPAKKSFSQEKKSRTESIRCFDFDPNTLPSEQWKQFGLSEKQVATIDKYRKAGGRFRVKEDVRKLYVVSEELYNMLEPYIVIKDAITDKPVDEKASYIKFFDTLMVDVNTADSARLTQLRGIGPAFSKRIIKYRDRIGGFHSKTQLLEVYGMDTVRYNGFRSNIVVDGSNIRKININTAEFKQFTSHPYFEYHIVKSIFNYRNRVGKITSIDELQKIDLMKPEIYNNIQPYITVE